MVMLPSDQQHLQHSGTYTLDHITDTAAVNAAVNNLYETALARAADQSGLYNLCGGNPQRHHDRDADRRCLDRFGRVHSKIWLDYQRTVVTLIFENSLGRQPTSAELTYWSGALPPGNFQVGFGLLDCAESGPPGDHEFGRLPDAISDDKRRR